MNGSIFSRSFAVTAIVAACAWAVGATGAEEFESAELRVGTWGGPWGEIQEELLVPKMETKGAEVILVEGSPQANLAKLIAARGAQPAIDVMEIIDATLPAMAEGDFLGKFDLSKIPNTKYLTDGQYDDTKVATWITQEGICYNEDKFEELGIPRPEAYEDLGHPELKGRVILPDITSGGGLAFLAGITHSAGGDLQNIKPGLEKIASLDVKSFWKSGSEAIAALQSGDAYAAAIHAGWCVRAYNAGLPVAMAFPRIDEDTKGVVKQGWMGIIEGTEDPEAAMAWINLFIDTDFQEEFARKRGVVPENNEAVKRLADDPVLNKLMILDPAEISNMLHVDYSTVNMSDWISQWNRMVAQ